MTLEEMNNLKPGDRIIYRGKDRATVCLCKDTKWSVDNDDGVTLYYKFDKGSACYSFRTAPNAKVLERIDHQTSQASTAPQSTGLYCSCNNPTLITNRVFHQTFQVCTICRKERQ